MSVNDVYKTTAVFSAPDADGEMVFNMHHRTETVNNPISDLEEAQEIAAAFRSSLELNYLLLIPNSITLVRVDTIGLTNPTIGVSDASGNAGGGGVNPMSYRSAPVAKLSSGLRGRSFNGRIYLMTCDESQQTGGVMLPSYRTSLETAVTLMVVLTGLTSTNVYRGTIYSPTLTGEGPIVDNIIQTTTVNPRLGTQRSRQDVA